MIMNERPYTEKRDLHIGGTVARLVPRAFLGLGERSGLNGARRDAEVDTVLTGARNEWGVEAWDISEENEAMVNEGGISGPGDGQPSASIPRETTPREINQWIGDTWVGEEWEAEAGDGLFADAQQALLRIDEHVRSNPWSSLAVAALMSLGLGYALGKTSSQR